MKKKIIVIEDDPFSQNFYKIILNKAGYDPIITESGDEVLNILNSENISLIIMDINLKNTSLNGKKIDGSVLSRTIKTDKSFNLPVLVVTAFSPNVKGNSFFEESLADDCVIKPIMDYNKLLFTIQKLIEKYGS